MAERDDIPDNRPPDLFYVEGGLINDYSGEASRRIRKELGIPDDPHDEELEEPRDPVEGGVRRINEFITNMGLAPLKAAEIESMLTRFTPPTPIRGIKKNLARSDFDARSFAERIAGGENVRFGLNDAEPVQPQLDRSQTEGQMFEAPGSDDFHLASGSDADGAGTPLGTDPDGLYNIAVDFNGVTRDATTPDVGAFELVAAAGGGPPAGSLMLSGMGA